MALRPPGGPSLDLPRTTFARTQAARSPLLSSRPGHTSILTLYAACPRPSSPVPPRLTFRHSSPHRAYCRVPLRALGPVSAPLSLSVLKLRRGGSRAEQRDPQWEGGAPPGGHGPGDRDTNGAGFGAGLGGGPGRSWAGRRRPGSQAGDTDRGSTSEAGPGGTWCRTPASPGLTECHRIAAREHGFPAVTRAAGAAVAPSAPTRARCQHVSACQTWAPGLASEGAGRVHSPRRPPTVCS